MGPKSICRCEGIEVFELGSNSHVREGILEGRDRVCWLSRFCGLRQHSHKVCAILQPDSPRFRQLEKHTTHHFHDEFCTLSTVHKCQCLHDDGCQEMISTMKRGKSG